METAPDNTSRPDPPLADAPKERQRIPILTWLACAVCVVVFVGLMDEPNRESWEGFEKWGYYPYEKILEGAIWALVTSVFVHLEFWHLAFNLYWLWVLGSALERAIGSQRWLGFFVVSALVSSGVELLFSSDTGIGASGVGYALFGFLWMARERYPRFREVMNQQTIILFLVWLVVCVWMTISGMKAIGNYAHFAGLGFGAGAGALVSYERWRRPVTAGLVALALAAALPLVWAPWSPAWTARRAFKAHMRGDYQSAVQWYDRSLQLGADKLWCWHSLALAYHELGDKVARDAAVRKLRELDEGRAREVEALFTEVRKRH